MELLRMFMLKIPGSSILNQKLQNEAASLSWEASIWSCQPSNGAASFKSKLPGWASGSLEAKNRAASSKTKLLGRLGNYPWSRKPMVLWMFFNFFTQCLPASSLYPPKLQPCLTLLTSGGSVSQGSWRSDPPCHTRELHRHRVCMGPT